jgi:predicted nucleic-acid-binding Zn-ribbon protein
VDSPASSGPRHARTSVDQFVAVTCPECLATELIDAHAVLASCSGCRTLIRCLHCDACGHDFASAKVKKLQCPRCLNALRTYRESEVAFAALTQQRLAGVAWVDGATLESNAPGLFGRRRRRGRPG